LIETSVLQHAYESKILTFRLEDADLNKLYRPLSGPRIAEHINVGRTVGIIPKFS